MQGQQKLNSLANRALLVKLTRSMYQPYAYDDNATKLIEKTVGVSGVGRYNKRLMKDSARLKDTNEKFNALYAEYIRNTVPWLDDGVRMVPNAIYFEFAASLRSLIAEAKAAADQLEQEWDAMVAADIARLGPLANPADYPTAQQVRERFNAQVRFFPIPQSEDFRVAVTDEDRAEMEAAIAEATANVTKHLIKEMLAPVAKLAAKLSVPIGTEGSIFRDSMVENVLEEVLRAERLNVNNDPEITELTGQIKTVVAPYVAVPAALREDAHKRADAAARMKELQDKMVGLTG